MSEITHKQPRCESRVRSAEQFRFKVTVNNAGEILTMYTTTTTPNNAIRNAMYQLAKKLGRNPQGLMMQLRDRATVALASV
jgi:ribosome-associated translation inhibitor RaiA